MDFYGETDMSTDLTDKKYNLCLPQYDAAYPLSSCSNTVFNSTTNNLTASVPVCTAGTVNHQTKPQRKHWKPPTANSANEMLSSEQLSKSNNIGNIIDIDSSCSGNDKHFPSQFLTLSVPEVSSKKRKRDRVTYAMAPSINPIIFKLVRTEPKRRRRQKSSKEGDAFESSLIGLENKINLINASGSKKVKSTQELIAGLHNRGKLTEISRIASLNSASQINSLDVGLSTKTAVLTPDTVFSYKESLNAAGKKNTTAGARFIAGAISPSARSIQEELNELAAKVHSIDTVAVAMTNENSAHDVVPCSCRLIEVEELPIVETKPNAPDPIQSSQKAVPSKPLRPHVQHQVNKPFRIVCAPEKPIKSIFDSDYDEEVSNHELAVVDYKTSTAAAFPEETVIKPISNTQNKAVIDKSIEFVPVQLALSPVPKKIGQQKKTRFKMVEDPNCLAAQYYVKQKRDVCEEHLEALHNAYVENVNGNWDCGGTELAIEPNNGIEPDLYELVVPTLNHMCADRKSKKQHYITVSRQQSCSKGRAAAPLQPKECLTAKNYGQMPSFDNLTDDNMNGHTIDGAHFKEWHEVVRIRSFNDELLTILPYVVID